MSKPSRRLLEFLKTTRRCNAALAKNPISKKSGRLYRRCLSQTRGVALEQMKEEAASALDPA